MSEILPCQTVHYVHCLRGGPADGDRVPSQHWYETLRTNHDALYVRDGDPEPLEESHGFELIRMNETDYAEPVWMKAPMRYLPADD